MKKKIARLFYSIKYKDNYKIVRILFFKIKKEKSQQPVIQLSPPNIPNIGKRTYCNPDIFIATTETEIGSFCSIGQQCRLGHGEHPIHFLSTSPYLYLDVLGYKKNDTQSYNNYLTDLKPIIIGNDVWIGDGVFIKNGVQIGDGAIIGANSVVTKDIEPYSIVVGNPAKILKYRFEQNIINSLLELKWWTLPDHIIKSLPYDNINDCIKVLKEIRAEDIHE